MKEKKFDENIESIYSTLTNEQKMEYKSKEDKFNKSFLVIGITLAIIAFVIIIGGFIWCIIDKQFALLAFVGIFGLLCTFLCIWIIKSSFFGLKSTDDVKIKTRIERLEKQKQFKKEQEEKQRLNELNKSVYYRLNFENIKNVTILDSYTEVSDKLHAFLNYQEIIQTRMYKFKVDYKDGTSQVITAAESSEEYSVLIPLVNKMPNMAQEKSNVEKLREYKQLLDDGIITQEDFEKKKKELL